MMKITIFHNSGDSSTQTSRELLEKLTAAGFTFDNQNPDVVLTVGGDGTLLGAFHHYADQLDKIRFIGVHTGHLGFYTDWRDFEIDDLVAALKKDAGQSISYPLLEVTVTYADTPEPGRFLALNESTLKRLSATLKTDVYIKGDFFESFRGDGLCISTPTGSTAYSKSVGGAVLHPRLKALQMTEIASINNLVYRTLTAPIVIAPDEWIDLRPEVADDYVMTLDQFSNHDRPIQNIRYRISDKRIYFASYRHTHFWDRVEGAFLGSKQS